VQDELAASSYYEAALYEDPKIDMEDLSDWEYYSDDYYDDDPTVKQNPVAARRGDATRGARRTQPSTQTNRDSRPRSSLKPDITSFQGVIWRTPSMGDGLDLAVQIYEPGNGEKVAFLENWREIFKSAQPALDKSRLRKRQTRDTPPAEPEFADDEFPCDDDYDDDDDEDNSDQMSDILSTDNMAEKDDAGDASNTTPELGQSPQEVPMPVDSAPAKRGRKRKAEVPLEEPNQDNPGGEETRARTKRVASARGAEKAARSDTSSGPVRRSARQMK
jgi:hypothetical protein